MHTACSESRASHLFALFPFCTSFEEVWSDFTLHIAILTLTYFPKIKHFLIMKYIGSLCGMVYGLPGSPR